eukprot:2637897-Rhodomonas_salina.1
MREVSKGKSLEGEVARFCEASEHVPTEVNKASLVQLHDQLRRARSTTVPNRPCMVVPARRFQSSCRRPLQSVVQRFDTYAGTGDATTP